MNQKKNILSFYKDALPLPIFPRIVLTPKNSIYPSHKHECGEFNFCYSGSLNINVDDQCFIVPPQYGLWLPAKTEHVVFNHYEVVHCSLYILSEYCHYLPQCPTILILNPLIRSILWHLQEKNIIYPETDKEKRLLQVLVDQLSEMPSVNIYLPTSNDRILNPILQFLDKEPNCVLSLTELAQQFNTTERTVIRRCKRELGITLGEWKQRLRIIKSLLLLDTLKYSIESIAFELGFSSSSAFSSTFRKLMKISPSEFRKRLGKE